MEALQHARLVVFEKLPMNKSTAANIMTNISNTHTIGRNRGFGIMKRCYNRRKMEKLKAILKGNETSSCCMLSHKHVCVVYANLVGP